MKKSNQLCRFLLSRKGDGYILWAAVFLVLVMLMVFTISYFFAIATVESQRSIAKHTLDQYVVLNAQEIYADIREEGDHAAAIDSTDFTSALIQAGGLQEMGGVLCSVTGDGSLRYKVRNISLRFLGVKVSKVELKYTVSVPLVFSDQEPVWVDIPITLISRYMPKYDTPAETP